jgi:hypothetical protein
VPSKVIEPLFKEEKAGLFASVPLFPDPLKSYILLPVPKYDAFLLGSIFKINPFVTIFSSGSYFFFVAL